VTRVAIESARIMPTGPAAKIEPGRAAVKAAGQRIGDFDDEAPQTDAALQQLRPFT